MLLILVPIITASLFAYQRSPWAGDGPAAVEKPGLHNVPATTRSTAAAALTAMRAFASLQELGIRTIITVDGSRPDVERAHRFGFRYVHLPIGYDSISEARRGASPRPCAHAGPIDLHCHHGKHCGPAAAAMAHRCLDDKCSAAQGHRGHGSRRHRSPLHRAICSALARGPAAQRRKTWTACRPTSPRRADGAAADAALMVRSR